MSVEIHYIPNCAQKKGREGGRWVIPLIEATINPSVKNIDIVQIIEGNPLNINI